MRLELRTEERQYLLEVHTDGDRFTVSLDGQIQDLEVLTGERGGFDLRLGGRRYRAFVAKRGDERYVFINGRVFTFHLPAEETNSETDRSSGPNITSQMPGTVVKLLVEPGQKVTVGNGLLIMESMKMETEITAPVAGTVTVVHVNPGQTVGLDVPLVDIEPAD